MGADLEFHILGPLEVRADGVPVSLGDRRQERCIAALLLEPNRPVTIDALVQATWTAPPPTARRQVRELVSHLRRIAADVGRDDLIVATRSGYALHVEPDELDSLRFERLVAAGRRSAVDDPSGAAAALREALALCRGPTLAGIESPSLEPATAQWDELRLTVREDWLALEVRLGNYGVALNELFALMAAHPLRERPVQLLMRALRATGRTSAALDVFRSLRDRLAEDLGFDPSPDLQELHRAILAGDQEGGESGRASAAARGVLPAQLPPDVSGFVGRSCELAQLDSVLQRREESISLGVVMICGTAGIGKTTLAVHWAHQVADRFPDGQLYVNLRGYDAAGIVTEPAVAVRGFLDALGAPSDRVPAGFDAQVGLLRSLLADRRMLILLDNARDAEQARPLLPGAPGCLVVVTSRSQLGGLTATGGARTITLALPTPAEARALIAHRLGQERVDRDIDAVDRIIASCHLLPLALAIVGAHADANNHLPLDVIADQLDETRGTLDGFALGDQSTDLRAVFSWSYDALSPEAARMFRLLGLHKGVDIGLTAAASLAGVPVAAARRLLAELARASMVQPQSSRRISLHDLLRTYATELVHAVDGDADRAEAQRRLLDHYLHTAHAAAMLVTPVRGPLTLAPARAGAGPEHLAGLKEAREWFSAEWQVLLDLVEQAAGAGLATHAWQLVWTVEDDLDRRGRWPELARAARISVDAATAADDRQGQAYARNGLARALGWLGEYEQAREHLRRAAALYGEMGDRSRQAVMVRNIGVLFHIEGRREEALAYTQQGLDLLPETVSVGERAYWLNNLGVMHAELGHNQQALACCQEALRVVESLEDIAGQAAVTDSLGYIHYQLGNYGEAIAWFERALRHYRETGDYRVATTLVRLGDTQYAAGLSVDAVRSWRQALDRLVEVNPKRAEAVRARLETAPPTDHARLLQICAFIVDNLGSPSLTLAQVARVHGLSLRQLERLFQREGLTPGAWLRDQRLLRCRKDLDDPACADKPVYAIGARWGFADPVTFNRAFSRAYGLPPGEYRRQVVESQAPR